MYNPCGKMKKSPEHSWRGSTAEQKRPRMGDIKGSERHVCKQLRVLPFSQFSGSFPFFREPKEIGTFSQDFERAFHHNSQQLRYYAPPPNMNDVSFNLRAGYKTANLRDDSVKEYLNDLLRWILLNKIKFKIAADAGGTGHNSLNTDFICWRGLLTKLLCSPYENREGWMISVIRHSDTWYLCEYDTAQRQQYKADQTDREKEMTYWGWKFEQYTTSETNGGAIITNVPVNNNEAFGSVVRSRLKQHSLVYGGEVDCCEQTDSGMKYVELKTNRELYQHNNKRNFKRFKLIKWWAQSFLLGVPKIVAGFRDDEGIVHRLETFHTLNIPKMLTDIRDPWDPCICFNFLDRFLDFVKQSVTENDHRVAYLFTWRPGEPVSVKRCASGSEYLFLPQWYLAAEHPST